VDNDTAVMTHYTMGGNDKYGCCVEVTPANSMLGSAAQTGDPFSITDAQILEVYSALTGFDPATGENDNGTDPQDMFKYWQKTGIAGVKIPAYVKVWTTSPRQFKQAVSIFGNVCLSISLPKSAQSQTGGLWDALSCFNSESVAGTWGGHEVICRSYNATGPFCITWGQCQAMTWSFLQRYCTLAVAVVNPLWIADSTNLTPTGLNVDALMHDVAVLQES
jgi:hypothetical protein